MLEKSFLNPNKIWFMIVLLHIIGSGSCILTGNFPIWHSDSDNRNLVFACKYMGKKSKKYWDLYSRLAYNNFTMHSLNISFQGTVLLNEILLLYVCWCCKKAYVKPTEYCHLKKVSLKSTFFIVIAAIFLFIMAGYVNACSMIVFQNLIRCFFRRNFRAPTRSDDRVAIMQP